MKRGGRIHCPADRRIIANGVRCGGAMRRKRETRQGRRGDAPAFLVLVEVVGDPGPVRCAYGDIFYVKARIRNLGTETLDSGRPTRPDYLSYHWETPDGGSLDYEGLRTPLPAPVPPGGELFCPVRISVTVGPGDVVARVEPVREGEAWIEVAGDGAAMVECTVARSDDEDELRSRLERLAEEGGSVPGDSVEGFWGRRASVRDAGEGWGWLDHHTVLEDCVFHKLGGTERNWLTIMLRRHGMENGGDWLSLGCGEGGFERWLAGTGVADSVMGVDISTAAVDIANRAARDEGLEQVSFRVADLNRDSLDPGAYDVVFTSMSLHHIAELEAAIESIYGALRPGGIFLANEYVGPSRFQFPADQKELAERVIAMLPRELRFHPVASREAGRPVYKDRYLSRTPEQWLEVDPSEAVRSSEIIGLLGARFPRTWTYPYGGSMMHLVLEHIAVNFDPECDRDRAIIRLIDLMESELIASGCLADDFAVLACRRDKPSCPS